VQNEHFGSSRAQWSPPPLGSIKCNVDAVVFGDGAGFGAVVRDRAGSQKTNPHPNGKWFAPFTWLGG